MIGMYNYFGIPIMADQLHLILLFQPKLFEELQALMHVF